MGPVLQQQIEKTKTENMNPETIAEMQFRGLQMLEMLKKIKSLEMLHILKLDETGFAVILRVKLKDPSLNIEELLTYAMKDTANGKLQLLEHEQENTYIYFMNGQPISSNNDTYHRKLSVYPVMPFGLKDGKARITLLGDNRQVKEFLEFMEGIGIHYRIISLMDAKFSPNSPVSSLTDKQREALILAFTLGYFDTPRKISSEQLAEKLGIVHSTLAVHLRRAERRLLSEILNSA
jgi:DNA-binding CsgD family transcriptional regulator